MRTAAPFVIVDNCREAAEDTQRIFGGEIKALNEHAGKLLHAELHFDGGSFIHFSDSYGKPFTKGENMKIIVQLDGEEEIRRIYEALLQGGQATVALQDTFFGALHGEVRDRYGIEWVLNYFRKQPV